MRGAVPRILATRTMERRRRPHPDDDGRAADDVLGAPAGLYALIIGALIPGSRWVQGLLMVGMYLFSVVTALIAAWLMSKTVKPLKAKRLPFVIELPPYRASAARPACAHA